MLDRNTLRILQVKYGIIGTSPLLIDALERLTQAAPTDLSVLINGETGTGKEVFANAVHGLSNRKKFPFVSVNCGAIPETLLESELFGHEKGAFTGAQDQRKGFFEVAHNGTIFLDEIGEMPINTQVKLLRILESGEFSRLGSSKVHKVDVRVIAATNRDLEYEVQRGNFRQDLFFRLCNVHILLPSLRQHPDDIPLLFLYFANNVAAKIGIVFEGISPEAESLLKLQQWPGNIRELKNTVETIITLEKANYLTADILKKYIRPALPPYINTNQAANNQIVHVPQLPQVHQEPVIHSENALIIRSLLQLQTELSEVKRLVNHTVTQVEEIKRNQSEMMIQQPLEIRNTNCSFSEQLENIEIMRLDDLEKKMIELALKRFEGNRRQAASALGLSERTLYRKIADLGME